MISLKPLYLLNIETPFTYILQPANDRDHFIVTPPNDGVLLVRHDKLKPFSHYASWQQVGQASETKTPWIYCKKGQRYILLIAGNKIGASTPAPNKGIVLHGMAKEFNLVKPIPKKRWSFDVELEK